MERGPAPCDRAVPVYEGSIDVDSREYLEVVEHGDDYVDQPIVGLDRIVSTSPRVGFVLDYPFERPYAGSVRGTISLRATIDAIRAAYRTMYEGAVAQPIPGMQNQDVRGPYGRAFHVIGDLVIERIELCADDTLRIAIGS